MGYMIREMDMTRTFCENMTMDALSAALPMDTLAEVIATYGQREARVRRLTALLTLWVIIGLHLYPTVGISGVLRKLVRGMRFLWPDPSITLPGDSALAYRRTQLGARPVVAAFHQLCRPMATAETPGAFLFGLRLMAIDGTSECVPDTPANAAAFGRHHSGRGASAFPQVQGVYLVECGTHAVVDAGFWPYHTSERVGGKRMLRSLQPGMLIMWDRGFHQFDMIVAARQRGAHVLSRLPAHVQPVPVRTLADGSVLAYLLPAEAARRQSGARLLVRIVTYTITNPQVHGAGETHRVLTTILNPRCAPAHALACAYHERWEIELVIDEIDTHQRLAGRTLRSLTPVGVIQELYGILLAHYAVRTVMHQAAQRVNLDPDRLSFVHALEIVRDAVPEFQLVAPAHVPALYERMLHDIATKRIPARRLRSTPRAVKRKMSKFPRKRADHPPGLPIQGSFGDAVQILSPPVLTFPLIPRDPEIHACVPKRHRATVLI